MSTMDRDGGAGEPLVRVAQARELRFLMRCKSG